MKKQIRSQAALALALALGGAMGYAQSAGQAIYKASCQSCHGTAGTPSPGIAKMLGVKAASEYKGAEKDQIEAIKNGKGKMKAFSSKLSDAQIKDVLAYFRTLK